jgi:hypothetical protein
VEVAGSAAASFHGGRRVESRESRRRPSHRVHIESSEHPRTFLGEPTCGRILPCLQICVDLVVHRMQRLAERAVARRRLGRCDVRVNGLLPCANTREGVRGHVQRVRR